MVHAFQPFRHTFLPGLVFTLAVAAVLPAAGQPREGFDYFAANRELIRQGVQAVLQCNGLFTSGRTLDQVFAQELAYLGPPRFAGPVGNAQGGDYTVDTQRLSVTVGSVPGKQVRAAFRPGIGCVVMAPDQGVDFIPQLPSFPVTMADPQRDEIPWPMGDLVPSADLPANVDAEALQAASDWAFARPSAEQDTISLLVTYRGNIIHERYASGFDRNTRTRTWSVAKSIAATLVGMLADQGKLALDAPLPLAWLPELAAPEADPRRSITLRHVLNMSSGLDPVDSFGREYVTGSGLAYWAGASSASGARSRGLVREPGTFWDYENYDTLLAVYAMKQVLGSDAAYHAFPRTALLNKLGMHHTLLSTDRFGDFVLSSQVYTTARDLARFGLLYQQNGLFNGERLLSQAWIDFVRTPAPATATRRNFYGGHWWLVPDGRNDVPGDAYAAVGNRGQFVIVVPSAELVIVRRGLDYGAQGFDLWALAREVANAIR